MLEREKLSHIVAIGLLLIAVQFIVVANYFNIPHPIKSVREGSIGCTREAKLCPDGS